MAIESVVTLQALRRQARGLSNDIERAGQLAYFVGPLGGIELNLGEAEASNGTAPGPMIRAAFCIGRLNEQAVQLRSTSTRLNVRALATEWEDATRKMLASLQFIMAAR